MATKAPLKTAKTAAKKSTPVKKATAPAKAVKPVGKVATPKKAVAKSAKTAPTASKVTKSVDPGKKATAKAPALPVAPKKAAKVAPKPAATVTPKPASTVATKKAMSSPKNGVSKANHSFVKEAKKVTVPRQPEPEAIRENGPIPTGKQIIVPSKPAINPRPSKAEKAEEPKSKQSVAVPKTSTDKKVDYEPEFIKSVLDSPVQQSNNPTMRYNDAELQEFRDLINKKLDAAKKELAYLQGLITRKDEMGGDETDNRYMTMEDGSMSMEREQLSQMASRQITFIDHLEKAIMRIENKTYGICRVTGKLIDKARLRAVPHATLSMEAKLGIVK